MMRHLGRITLSLLLLSLSSGCATILGGGAKEEVRFESEPSDAKVMVDGIERGRTPMSLNLKKKSSYTIKMQKGCYTHDNKVYVSKTKRTGWVVADYIFALPTLYLSVGIDYLNGAWNTFDKNLVSVRLRNTCNNGQNDPGKPADRECQEGAKEFCDGKDNDCDGVIDEGCK